MQELKPLQHNKNHEKNDIEFDEREDFILLSDFKGPINSRRLNNKKSKS